RTAPSIAHPLRSMDESDKTDVRGTNIMIAPPAQPRPTTDRFSPMWPGATFVVALLLLPLLTMLAGCNSTPTGSARIRGVNLNQISAPAPHDEPIVLSAAKNEWTNFTVQVDSLPRGWGNAKSAHYALRVSSLKLANAGGPAIDARNASAFQILNMPI